MIKSIKKLKEINDKKNLSMFDKNQDGDFVYEFRLKKSEIYSSFATKNNKIVNESLIEHVDEICDCLTKNDTLEFRVLTPKEDAATPNDIEQAFDNHYTKRMAKTKQEYRAALGQGLVMFFVGVLIFSLYFVLRTFIEPNSVVSFLEIVDIASWVFVWEAVDIIFLGIIQKRMEQLRYKKILNAKISVIKEKWGTSPFFILSIPKAR